MDTNLELCRAMFEDLHPGRRLVFQYPVQEEMVSVVVLDSAVQGDEAEPVCAAMLVPAGDEGNWMYSSEGGQWQLLASAAVNRMVLFLTDAGKYQAGEVVVGLRGEDGSHHPGRRKNRRKNFKKFKNSALVQEKEGGEVCDGLGAVECSVASEGNFVANNRWRLSEESLKGKLSHLVVALVPKILFQHGIPVVPFVSYSDNVLDRVIVEECFSPLTGFMVVEDVELGQGEDGDETQEAEGRYDHLVQSEGGDHLEGRQCHNRCFRRRLRFKRMPNLIQTEVSLSVCRESAVSGGALSGNKQTARVQEAASSWSMVTKTIDHSVLVHIYLPPVVAGLVLVSRYLEACMEVETQVKVLCIGVGGGALPSFLHMHFPFKLQAVDLDEVVLRLARQHFGLIEDESLQVKACDGIKLIEDLAKKVCRMGIVEDAQAIITWQKLHDHTDISAEPCLAVSGSDHISRCLGHSEQQVKITSAVDKSGSPLRGSADDPRFHVIVLDVDAGDPRLHLNSPPTTFLEKQFLLAVLISLHPKGMLAMNVVPLGHKTFESVVAALKDVFAEVYAVDVDGDVNQVVFALPSSLQPFSLNGFILSKLEQLVDRNLVNRIRKI